MQYLNPVTSPDPSTSLALAHCCPQIDGPLAATGDEPALRKAFDNLDIDKSGTIDKFELKSALLAIVRLPSTPGHQSAAYLRVASTCADHAD